MGEWLSIPELAKRIGLSKEAVYRLARTAELPGGVKVGRLYVVHDDVFCRAASGSLSAALAVQTA